MCLSEAICRFSARCRSFSACLRMRRRARLHDLRHSAASAMINAGVDLYTVGGVLGHQSATSTKRYSHLATSTLAAAVSMIGKKVQTHPEAKAA